MNDNLSFLTLIELVNRRMSLETPRELFGNKNWFVDYSTLIF